MCKSAWLVASVAALSCVGLGGCAGSNNAAQHRGVEVTFINSNPSGVMIYGSPFGKPGELVGCRNPKCPESKPGEQPSGNVWGWTETRQLPRRYRLVLMRTKEALNCPAATRRPSNVGFSTPYAVVYDITPGGRCIIASHSPWG